MLTDEIVDHRFWKAAHERGVVVLAGAGVSADPPAALPGWLALNDAIAGSLAEKVGGDIDRRAWTTSVADRIATRRRDGTFPPEYQAQILEEVCGMTYFEALTTLDVTQYNQAHDGIAALAQSGALRAVITTNFDRLIELALEDRGVLHESYYDDTGFSLAASSLVQGERSALPVIHLHGSVVDAGSLVDTLKQRKLGRSKLLTDVVDSLDGAYWLYLGFSGADLLGDPDYLGLRKAAERATGGTFVRYPGSNPDPPPLNAGAQCLINAFVEPAAVPIAHVGDILTAMADRLAVPTPRASFATGTGGGDVVRRLTCWADSLDASSAAVCLAALLEANRESERAVRLLDHLVRKEPFLRGDPGFPLAAINYGRLGQAWGRFVNVLDLNGAQANAAVESLQSLLRLMETPLANRAATWTACAMLWNGLGAAATSSARDLLAALTGDDSTRRPEDLVDGWLAAAQIAFITFDQHLLVGSIASAVTARERAKTSGDVVRTARVDAFRLLLGSVVRDGNDMNDLLGQHADVLAEARRVGDQLTLGFRQLAVGRWLVGPGRNWAARPADARDVADRALSALTDAGKTLRSLNLDPWTVIVDIQTLKALADRCAAEEDPQRQRSLIDEILKNSDSLLGSGAIDRFPILEPQIYEVAGQIARQTGAREAAEYFERAVTSAERTGQPNRTAMARRDLETSSNP